MRRVVRRGAPSDVEPLAEPLKKNASGMPNGMAFVISNISLSHSAREPLAMDPMATRRSEPEDFDRLFADAGHMQQVVQVLRDDINTVVTVSGRDRKRPTPIYNMSLGASWESCLLCVQGFRWHHLVTRFPKRCCPRRGARQTHEASGQHTRKTLLQRADVARPSCPTEFPMRLHRGCPVGILRPKASTDFNNVRTFWATLRHDMLFQALSSLRVHPIRQTHVRRGVIPEDNPLVFRVAATFHGTSASVWHATDKRRAAFVIPMADIKQLSLSTQPRATANLMWRTSAALVCQVGAIVQCGQVAHTLAPASPIAGDVVLVILHWSGNSFYAQEVVRRASVMETTCSLLNSFCVQIQHLPPVGTSCAI